MNDQVEEKVNVLSNLLLWVGIASFIFGVLESFGVVKVVSESLPIPYIGPILIIFSFLALIYPIKTIRSDLAERN